MLYYLNKAKKILLLLSVIGVTATLISCNPQESKISNTEKPAEFNPESVADGGEEREIDLTDGLNAEHGKPAQKQEIYESSKNTETSENKSAKKSGTDKMDVTNNQIEYNAASDSTSMEDPSNIKSIVINCLAHADNIKKIYLGEGVETDEEAPPVGFVSAEYRHVSDTRISTPALMYQYFQSAFEPSLADKLAQRLFDSQVFTFMNKKVYISTTSDFSPMTEGEWRPDTMEIVSSDSTKIEVNMETTLRGAEQPKKTLTIVKTNVGWVLTDSYFID